MMKWFYYIVQQFLRLLSLFYPALLLKLVIKREAEIQAPVAGATLVIANHRSYWDPIFISLAFPFFSSHFPLRFIAKNELFEKPLSRLIFKVMGAFPAKKGLGLDAALAKPTELLRQGQTVIFFPEGKRYQDMGISKPKQGVGELVKKFPNTPIIPIGLSGTEQLERKGWWYRRPRLKLHVGHAFTLNKVTSSDEVKNFASSQISEVMMRRVKDLL